VALHGAWLSWHHVRFREIVRIGDPADVVGEFNVTVGEVGRRPAVDWWPDVLRGTDDDREDDEYNHCVAVVQAVADVVVVTRVRLDYLRHRVEDALQHHRSVGIRLRHRRFNVDLGPSFSGQKIHRFLPENIIIKYPGYTKYLYELNTFISEKLY